MTNVLKVIVYGILVGAVFGVVIGMAGYVKYDRHGYATIALILISAVSGALFGLAGGLGVYMKQKFEGQSDD